MNLLRRLVRSLACVCLGSACAIVTPALCAAAPVRVVIAPQAAADALMEFSQKTGTEVLFPFDELQEARSPGIDGEFTTVEAINRLLAGTGFSARRTLRGKFVVAAAPPANGEIHGRLLDSDGNPAAGARVWVRETRQAATTDNAGYFVVGNVRPGKYAIHASSRDGRRTGADDIEVEPGETTTLAPRRFTNADELSVLDPFVVEGRFAGLRPLGRSRLSSEPRTAAGNLDLPRTENDAFAFTIYDRDQISRSGVVNLNEFLQRQLLESDGVNRPPEQNSTDASYLAGSTNLNLRGFGGDETVILVNGRRMPEILTTAGNSALPPDVNLIPLSIVQQVQVLPSSASALYSGNPVGGVINIVLRPDINATELTATYTNALRGFDAPQTSLSLLHGQSLLDDRLKFRLSATLTESTPPTEAELGYRLRRIEPNRLPGDALYRATPNVRSEDLLPLFAGHASPLTSVAPGADGEGGIASFAGREGQRNFDFFDSSAGFAVSSLNSVDHPFGRQQSRTAFYGSVTYDIRPWLQIGLDALHARTIVHRGLDIFPADLALSAASPLNPFGQNVFVSLNETAAVFGENYNEARLTFSSAVLGAIVKLPADWRVALDLQYANNQAQYRAISSANLERWQELVDAGVYNPLRDTQRFGPPDEFYERVLIFRGGPHQFVTLGDYDTIDAAARITQEALPLPTGRGAINAGVDYRSSTLAGHREHLRYGDGSIAGDELRWTGRTLERLSVFGELQANVVPDRWLPRWIKSFESDLALRYIMADSDRETTFAPTYGLKLQLANGFTLRGSITTSNRFPTPQMSRSVGGGGGPGTGVDGAFIYDPVRGESYEVLQNEAFNRHVIPEEAITQTAGIVFQKGDAIHRLRASLDFIDTRKSNEIVWLEAQDVVTLESVFSDRLTRHAPAPGDASGFGRIASVTIGSANASWRRSNHWSGALDYAYDDLWGGTLELYARLAYYQRYDQQLFANSPIVDQLRHPDGVATLGLLRLRTNFGAGWSNRHVGFGLDGQYFHSRPLPINEQVGQGGSAIRPYWQFDAYLQADVARLLPGGFTPKGMRVQLRINNLSGFDYPKYVSHGSGAGVQPYGDWRGRTYSLSFTTAF